MWTAELPLPWWAVSLLVVALMLLGWALGRGDRRDTLDTVGELDAARWRHTAVLAEHGVALAAVQARLDARRPAADLPAEPPPAVPETVEMRVAGSTLPPRGAGVGPTEVLPTVDLARWVGDDSDARAVLAAARPEPAGDGPDSPDRDGDGPAPVPVPAYQAAVLPRYDWSATGWDPLTGACPPPPGPGWSWGRGLDLLRRVAAGPLVPLRAVRWAWAGRSWRTAGRVEQREVAQAAELLGFDPVPEADPAPVVPRQATGPVETAARPVLAVPAPRTPDYRPRHDFSEVPPSLRRRAELLPVTLRCTVIARAVSRAGWRPPPTSRLGLELWAKRVARRHGRLPQLGRELVGSLP